MSLVVSLLRPSPLLLVVSGGGLALSLDEAGVCGNEVTDESLSPNHSIVVHLVYINLVVCQTSYAYSLRTRANKLETAAVQGPLACLTPPCQCIYHAYRVTVVMEDGLVY